jgi:hypothetical protein
LTAGPPRAVAPDFGGEIEGVVRVSSGSFRNYETAVAMLPDATRNICG